MQARNSQADWLGIGVTFMQAGNSQADRLGIGEPLKMTALLRITWY
jgi:hypothetical protein